MKKLSTLVVRVPEAVDEKFEIFWGKKVLQCYTPQLPTDAIQQIQKAKKEKLLTATGYCNFFLPVRIVSQ